MKRWKLITIIAVILLVSVICNLAGFKSATPGLAAGSWDWSIAVTIDKDQVDGTHSNIPIYLSNTISELATVANGGYIENTDATGGITGSLTVPADFDIGTDEACSTDLSFEFESYTATNGAFDLFVKVPSINDSSDTTIYFCFGDSGVSSSQESIADTWSNGYVAVWHLAEASGTFYDSLGSHDGTDYVSDTGKDGKVGDGQEFDGTDYIQVSANAAFQDQTVTLALWEWASTSSDSNDVLFDNSTSSPGGGEGGYMHKKGGRLTTRKISASGVTSRIYPTEETWEYVVMTIDLSTGTQTISLDGGTGTDTDTIDSFTPSSNTIRIGGRNDAIWFDPFIGKMDEVRFSSVLRSSDWISTQYNNQSAPNTFVSYGAADNGSTPTPTPTETSTPTPTPTATATPPPVIMGDSSYSGIPTQAVAAVATAVSDYRPEQDLSGLEDTSDWANMFALTSYSESDATDYYWISVVGLVVDDTGDLDGWDLSNAIWQGLAIAEDTSGTETGFTAYIEGDDPDYSNLLDAAALPDAAGGDEGGTGSATYYFPWAAGYDAYYGTKGVHGAGPNDPTWGGVGWKAVDWVGGVTGYGNNIFPNGVYVSQSGAVSYVCQDDVQTWVQIGDFLYGHLVDNSTLRVQQYHSQGSYLGALVTGTHLTEGTASLGCPDGTNSCVDSVCGYMYQQPTSYHLHWGFKPSGNYFTAEGWALNITSENWVKGADTVGPGEYMKAEWAANVIVPTPGPTITPGGPTPTPGGAPIYVVPSVEGGAGQPSIWNGFIASMKSAVQRRVDKLNEAAGPDDTGTIDENSGRNYITLAVSGFRIFIRTIYILLRSNLDLRITLTVVTYILLLEPIRAIAALWMWIKEKIPFVG